MDDESNYIAELVSGSKDANEESKRVCLALMRASDGFKKPVFYTGSSKHILEGIHNMISSQRETCLNTAVALISDFEFKEHYGHVLNGELCTEDHPKKGKTNTIWLADYRCLKLDAKAKEVSQEEVDKTQLIES